MKVSAVLAVVCATVAYANVEYADYADADEFDIGGLLKGGIGPLLNTAKCAVPCVVEGANKIVPKNQGLIDAACGNIEKIKNYSAACLNNCHVKPGLIKTVVNLAKEICDKRQH